jgi:hypothetical protein
MIEICVHSSQTGSLLKWFQAEVDPGEWLIHSRETRLIDIRIEAVVTPHPRVQLQQPDFELAFAFLRVVCLPTSNFGGT